MADAVLGHGGLPFVDAGEERCGAKAEDLLQVVADCGDDGVVGKLPDAFGVRSGEEAAEQGAIPGGAVGELIVDECRAYRRLPSLRGTRNPKPGGRDWRTSRS